VGRSEWSDYYDEHEGREPREMLLEVLDAFGSGSGTGSGSGSGEGRSAVDLGCGSGIDTLAMLKRGWTVFAADAEEEAIDRVRRRVPRSHASRLTTVVARMEDVDLPQVDLVWASFSLFFCRPNAFADVWARIGDAIVPGGRFAGQLLGDRDTWAPQDDISSFTREEALALLSGFEVERLEETEEDGTATSGDKHWHVFHAVARRPEGVSGP
jgi:tellurite methyltransferase